MSDCRKKGRWEDLLAENGQEAGVQPADALFARKSHKAGDEPRGVVSLRHETDTCCLEWREEDVGKESAERYVSTHAEMKVVELHSATLDAPRYIAVRCLTAASWLPAIWTNCFFQYSYPENLAPPCHDRVVA